MKSLIFSIVCAVAVIILSFVPNAISIEEVPDEWRFDPNGLLDVSGIMAISDSNSFLIFSTKWEPPKYKCPKHGITIRVVNFTFMDSEDTVNICIDCMADVVGSVERYQKPE